MMATTEQLSPYLTQWGLLGTCHSGEYPVVRSVGLESVKTSVTVRGFVAQVTATLVYHNTSQDPLQVECVFPVDEEAAVYKFEARLDGRTIIAHCMEKKKAEKIYDDAVAAGKTAVLARENQLTGDILQLSLGNLPPDSRVELVLGMIMELQVKSDGGVSFILPTVLNPRYCPADLHIQNYQDLYENRTVYVPKHYSIDIECSVSGNHQVTRIISHTDPISVTIDDDTTAAQVKQDGGYNCDHDWSMIVYYQNPYKTHVLRESGDRSATGLMKDHLIMISLFPEVPQHSYSNKNEIIFVIDRSGSMVGSNIQSARATLLLFLKSLPQGCFFNIISFGSSFSLLFPNGSLEYNEKSLSKACRLQETMEADMGGTEILGPLKNIYSKPPMAEFARQILVISDGAVMNVDQVKSLVLRHSHETRVFSVGIGDGASTALIKGVARAGRGRAEMVTQQDMLQQKVMGLVTTMVQDSVQDVSVSCQVEPPTRVTLVPRTPPVIFGGQHLVLYVRVPPGTMVKEISVKGRTGDGQEVGASLTETDIKVIHDAEMSLHRLAARAQINQWQMDEDEECVESLVSLSVSSGVVSRRTALVGVDHDSGSVLKPQQPTGLTLADLDFRSKKLQSTSSLFSMDLGKSRLGGGVMANFFNTLLPAKSSRGGRSSKQTQKGENIVTGANDRFHRAACSPEPQQQLCSLSASSTDMKKRKCASLPMPCSASACTEEYSEIPSSSPASKLMEIVRLQKFDGSWMLDDAARVCDVPLKNLKATNTVKVEAVWGTAVVVAVLETRYSEERDQWNLMVTKAQAFIASSGHDVQALLKAAREFLNSI